ncbi:MAG: long-chain fatty acid--CoA ligase [Gemmatimonadota bacterium]|nr:MAG: long-chain fatty acid--CoA ligase [Gemmatimonadota bacterium]
MTQQALRSEVLQFIRRGFQGDAAEDSFEPLALAAFEHQFNHNVPYRRFCERRGKTPDSVQSWAAIPAVPTAAFKEAKLVCGQPDRYEAVFRTSGTSQGQERRGVHYVPDLSLYREAALPNFQRHFLPDAARLRMLVLGPSPQQLPDSSLSWMLELVRAEFGAAGSRHFVDRQGLQLEALRGTLRESEVSEMPVALLGTAAAFAYLLEALGERDERLRLPVGSRVMETGGFKRRGGEISRERFYAMLAERLGVSEHYCVAEYGMTELCSQFYDNVLWSRTLGRVAETRFKVVPPWVRTQVVDAETLEPLAAGRVGVLRHFDLANLDSVLAVQTDDLGVAGSAGFEILGRAAGAELRGCSIAMDEWLTAQR